MGAYVVDCCMYFLFCGMSIFNKTEHLKFVKKSHGNLECWISFFILYENRKFLHELFS